MVLFNKENLLDSSKRCKLFRSALKEVFISCRTCNCRHMPYCSSDLEDDNLTSDFDNEQELVVSIIRSRAMEAKVRRKGNMMIDGFSAVIHPTSGMLFVRTPKQESKEEEIDDFVSAQSHFSNCLSAVADSEGFFSVGTNFSSCLSMKDVEFAENGECVLEWMDSNELRRRAIIQEVCHCEGWPFGLCRKALLLPPLPKSPSDSWTWCKGSTKIIPTY